MNIPKRLASTFILFYLKFWAKVALTIHRPTIIGIAGSVGKSSTKQALYAALKDYAPTAYTHGNSETGVPLGILGLSLEEFSSKDWIKVLLTCPFHITNLLKTRYLIIEMGTDDPYPPKNMSYLLSIVKPDIALWLNVFPVHTLQFSKTLATLSATERQQLTPDQERDFILKQLAKEDGQIITQSNCHLGIYHADDPYISSEILQFLSKNPLANLKRFGHDDGTSIAYDSYQVNLTGTTFSYRLKDQSISITLPGFALPLEYQQVFAATILAAQAVGMNLEQISQNLTENFTLPPSRGSLLAGINNSLIIDSSYNASTAAVLSLFNLVKQLKDQTNRPVVLLLGDMRELGDLAQSEHTKIKQAVIGLADQLYAVGPLTKQYIIDPLANDPQIPSVVQWFENSTQLGEFLKSHLPKDALVLAKGSQNTIFLEESVKAILANSDDVSKLCRQEPDWMKRKVISISTS